MIKRTNERNTSVLSFRMGISISIITAWLSSAGCGPPANADQKFGAAAGNAPAVALEVVMAGHPARKTLTLTTIQPARMESLEQTPIHSKLSAYVGEVLVDYGDRVKKNQPLLKLTAPEVNAEVAQKLALVDQARAELLQSEAGVKATEAALVTTQSKVAQTEAGLERARADITRWRAEFSRVEQLANSGSVNRQLVDEAQQKLGSAEASLKETSAAIEAAKAEVRQSAAEIAKASSDVATAKSRIRVAEANVAQVQAMHSYLTIAAPFDGVVTQRNVDPGHFVQPASDSAKPLIVVARSDKVRVFVAVPEMEAAYVDLGDLATIEVQSLRSAEFTGKVTRTGFSLDQSSRALDTIIDLDSAEGRLRPGLYATARITLQEQKNAVALPTGAVVRQGRDAFCYRLVDGKANKTPIQLGIKVGDDFEITSGVTEKDTVILNKASSLKHGQQVEVLQPKQ